MYVTVPRGYACVQTRAPAAERAACPRTLSARDLARGDFPTQVVDGALDAAGKVLTLNAEGPDVTTPDKTAKYRDVIEFKSDNHRTLTSYALGPDGDWKLFMSANYHRKR